MVLGGTVQWAEENVSRALTSWESGAALDEWSATLGPQTPEG